jgi:Cys-rich protein (TIGR01571 family)
LLSIRV